jgi:signal transduction histidine kinase
VIIDQSFRVLHVDAAEVWLADPVRRELILLGSRGYSSAYVQATRRLSYDAPRLAAIVARTERIQRVEDVRTSTVGPLNRQAYLQEGISSLLDVPLCARDHLVGVLCYATRTPRHLTAANLAFVTSAAGLFAVTIENSRLFDELRQALRLREEFMAAAAHELRSPVTVIQGRAQLTLLNDAREEQSRRALERILQASRRIGRLTEDLLTVLHVRPGFLALQRERFDLGALTKAAAEQTAQTTEHYDFQVTTDGPLFVEADRALICEVLSRLLENAMRYAPEGGRIQVRARRTGSSAVVAVTDHGLGISLERQPFVFEPFYELIPGGNPGYTGLVSLGLHLSKQIVEGHGGRIWFISTPGSGSTFSFSLPLAREQ